MGILEIDGTGTEIDGFWNERTCIPVIQLPISGMGGSLVPIYSALSLSL